MAGDVLHDARQDFDPATARAAEAAVAALRRPTGVLDGALRDGGGFLVGGRFTVADIAAAEVFRYAQAAPELFSDRPHVRAWIEAGQARPAFRAMMAERALEPE
jgi:glutathione S-transferase